MATTLQTSWGDPMLQLSQWTDPFRVPPARTTPCAVDAASLAEGVGALIELPAPSAWIETSPPSVVRAHTERAVGFVEAGGVINAVTPLTPVRVGKGPLKPAGTGAPCRK